MADTELRVLHIPLKLPVHAAVCQAAKRAEQSPLDWAVEALKKAATTTKRTK